ncbi:MAG: hypothetical protein WC760_08405 [Bacteroidia bacterium]|jgi:hypothetical protein
MLSLFVISCYKEPPVIPVDNTKPSGSIYYSAWGRTEDSAGFKINRSYFNGNAYFFSTPLMNGYQAEIVGDVMIGSITIPFDSIYYYQFLKQQIFDPINPIQFGRTLLFSIEGGDSYAPATNVIYVPQIIYIRTPLDSLLYTNERIHSKKEGMSITWNTDLKNKQVLVSLFYDGVASSNNNPGLSNKSYTARVISVHDNGTFTLDPDLFADFEPQSVVNIQVYREGKGWLISNKHKVDITASTYSYKEYTIAE